MRKPVLLRGVSLAAMAMAISGCTLVKPVIGAVTGPFVILGESGVGDCSCCCGDGRGLAVGFAFLACIGAAGGLVNGVISDIQVLSGAAHDDPTCNWWDPFRTNTSRSD